MRINTIEAASRWLKDNNWLGESLLVELALEYHGYSVRLVIQRVIDAKGELLDPSLFVTIRMDAVKRLLLIGSIPPSIIDHPGYTNWDLSGFSVVKLFHEDGMCRLLLSRESGREVEILARRIELSIDEP